MSTSKELLDPDEPDLVREKARIILKREQRKSWTANPWRPSERVLDCDRAIDASKAYTRTLFDDLAEHLLRDMPKYGDFKSGLLRAQKEVMDDLTQSWHEFLPKGFEHHVSLTINCLPKVREDLIEYQETWWLRYLDLKPGGTPATEGPAPAGATQSTSSGTAETGDSTPNVEECLILSKPDGGVTRIRAQVLTDAVLVMHTGERIENGDRLIRTLPSGLQIALSVDDPGFRAAVGNIPAHCALKVHRAAPIDTLADAEFWRGIRAGFERFSERQRTALGLNRDHPRWLSAACSFDEENDKYACLTRGGIDGPSMSEFNELATQAAIAVGCPAGADPVEFWLHCLCQDLLENPRPYQPREIWESLRGGGIIHDLLSSSIAYCSRLAAKADVKANNAAEQTLRNSPDTSVDRQGRQPPANANQNLNPSEDFLYERLSPDDAKYELLKRFDLKGWGDSFDLIRRGLAGEASLKDFIDGCVTTFADGVEVHIELKDETPISERCREVGRMAEEFIRVFSAALEPESDRLGKDTVSAAGDEFSRRIGELSASAKTRILQNELTGHVGVQSKTPAVTRKRGRRSAFTADLLGRAREMKQAGKRNVEIARVLYQTLTPTDDQRRSVPTILKHHFGSKKPSSGVEE